MQLQLPWKSRHKPRNFQNLKCKLAANALDISVTLFYAIDLENSTCPRLPRHRESKILN